MLWLCKLYSYLLLCVQMLIDRDFYALESNIFVEHFTSAYKNLRRLEVFKWFRLVIFFVIRGHFFMRI